MATPGRELVPVERKPSLIRRILGSPAVTEERGVTGIFPLTWEQLAQQLTFTFNGIPYPYGYGASTTYSAKQEPPEGTFEGYVQFAYRTNGVVFACMAARLLLFSEARFQFRRMRQGRPGDLFGTEALRILERPWPNGTTGDLLARMIQDADLAGNFYARRGRNALKRMRPDWVDIILGSDSMPDEPVYADDVEIAGYAYWPGGRGRAEKPVLMLPEEVCHFAPLPDPLAHFRGMSWLTPVVRDIMADNAATALKQSYFENGATPNMLVKADANLSAASFQEFVNLFKQKHDADLGQVYRFLFLGGGADATVIGNDMKQMDFKATQGGGETRICMAARVPAIIVGSSEGLDSATYSNYGQARRALSDLTMSPLWRQASGALATVVDVPADAQLWHDVRDIPFLQEDVKDAADIVASQAQAIRTLTDGGYNAESVVAAVVANDLRLLEHSGMLPVQVRPPGEGTTDDNGNGRVPIGAAE